MCPGSYENGEVGSHAQLSYPLSLLSSLNFDLLAALLCLAFGLSFTHAEDANIENELFSVIFLEVPRMNLSCANIKLEREEREVRFT